MLLAALVVAVGLLFAVDSVAAAPPLTVTNPRCEYLTDPLGIDVAQPRLSWELEASDDARGRAQSAYQIRVASDPAKLGEPDLWDSGKVESNATNQIAYAGRPLTSRDRTWWSVRSWDESGQPSEWSGPAEWTMGLLEPGDWQAQWIEAPFERADPVEPPEVDLAGNAWVWFEHVESKGTGEERRLPDDVRYFRHAFELPEGEIVSAWLHATADDQFNAYVNDADALYGWNWRGLRAAEVSRQLRGGKNVLAIRAANNANTPAGLVGRLTVRMAGGEVVTVDVSPEWKASAEAAKGWTGAGFDDSAWGNAERQVDFGDARYANVGQASARHHLPVPTLATSFAVEKRPVRATLYATALGLHDLHINGERASDVELAPGWTDYRKRVYYHTSDVTGLVKQGENTMSTLLGDGWYAGYIGLGGRDTFGDRPKLLAQLEIEFEDGTTQVVVTDEQWQATRGGTTKADLLDGWSHDARLRTSQPARVTVGGYDGLVQAYPGDPVTRQQELPAQSVERRAEGVYVFDLGQNMVGWARFEDLVGRRGEPITIRYAETLHDDGTLYTVALRHAQVIDSYIPADDGAVSFEPQFTFHGFRYVEVSGLAEAPSADAVTGIVIHNDMTRTGEFASSSELVNQLAQNIIWGQKGNYLEIPTDCPQRDERLGWTGDAQFFMPTAVYNYDVAPFFTKWLVDLDQDSQREDGAFAAVAPSTFNGGYGATAWGDAAVICPYLMYRNYGDTRVIDAHWEPMVRYIDYLRANSEGHIRTQGEFGDWVNLGGGAKSEVIGTSYYAHVVALMAEMARVSGRDEEAASYGELAEHIRQAFIENFIGDDGSIADSSQTGYALAFTMGLIPEDKQAAAAERFMDEMRAFDMHLATGFIGTPRLLPALTNSGQTDAAYKVFLNDDYPSWLYQVRLGATTMWERWDGYTPELGFQTPTMNSLNHYAFGSVGEWMYGTVAGIETDGPGFRRVTIRPQPGPGLTSAEMTYKSINGTIASAWAIDGDRLTLEVTIPPNVTATVHVPTPDAASITESGDAIDGAVGVESIGDGVFRVGSGTYRFEAMR